MQNHEHFEELCALAAVGQLTAAECKELESHLGECRVCRETLGDLALMTDAWIPASAPLKHRFSSLRVRGTGELRTNFLARARDRGLNLTRQSDSTSRWARWPLHFARPFVAPAITSACVISILAVLIVMDQRSSRVKSEAQSFRAQAVDLVRENDSLKEKVAADEQRIASDESGRTDRLNELGKLRNERDAVTAKVSALEERLASVGQDRDAIARQLSGARAELAQVSQNYAAATHDLSTVQAQLDSARAADAQDRSLIVAQQRKIEELAQRPVVENAALDRDHQLLAADRDIRELMGARNLHIIDVHDRDSKGRSRQSFGRVFYTEGKSLIFYAFDLSDPKLKNASFQAWGNREDGSRQAVNLGLFYQDDKQQSRWVLHFDDAAVLAEIDSVFVTVAPPGGDKRPSGEKLLYAFLNFDANHP